MRALINCPSEESLIINIVDFLNRASGANIEDDHHFWDHVVPTHVMARFGTIALRLEEKEQSAIRRTILSCPQTTHDMLLRILSKCGISLSSTCEAQLSMFASRARTDAFEFSRADIIAIKPIVHHMQINDFVSGKLMSLLAQQRETRQEAPQIVVRLADSALEKLRLALKTLPDDTRTRHAVADALQTKAFALQRELFTITKTNGDDASVNARKAHIRLLFEQSNTLRHGEDSSLRCSKSGVSYGEDILGWDVTRCFRRGDSMPSIVVSCHPISWVYWVRNRAAVKGTHFLPLAINDEHLARSRSLLFVEIFRAYNNDVTESTRPIVSVESATPIPLNHVEPFLEPEHDPSKMTWYNALTILANAMNSVCLKIATVESSQSQQDAAIACYTRLHFTLLQLAHEFPEMVDFANERVRKFVNSASERAKPKRTNDAANGKTFRTDVGTRNLGVFLIYLLLSDDGDWSSRKIREAYLLESLSRNAFWM